MLLEAEIVSSLFGRASDEIFGNWQKVRGVQKESQESTAKEWREEALCGQGKDVVARDFSRHEDLLIAIHDKGELWTLNDLLSQVSTPTL